MDGDEARWALAQELADAFLDGRWRAEELAERGVGRLDRWPEWITALALRVCAIDHSPPRAWELTGWIDLFLASLPADTELPRRLRSTAAIPPVLRHDWPIAPVDSVAALAARLELSDGQLDWLADVRGLERSVQAEKLRNYRYRTVPRRTGGVRMIELPKARLKEIQRWTLRAILDHVPPHAAAHGFVRGRSVRSHAALHCGRPVVVRFDLKDFFASVPARRVAGIFRTVGYSPRVARVLTGLATNVVPAEVWRETGERDFRLGRQLATPHLPQGAPTSPALANLAAFRLDRRLSGLAAAAGLRYSRYADDLTFSGPHWSDAATALVATIVTEEGFALHPGKTWRAGAGQRQAVCGVVVNAHPNVSRGEYDELKAIIHNAVRHGPVAANRAGVDDFRAHLAGRVAWVTSLNPARGAKLRAAFARIDWP